MKFYIASGFQNKEAVHKVAESLKLEGNIQTYDWTQNERATTFEDLSRIGELEKTAVINADILILLLPAGIGSHIEMGLALGSGKRVFIFSAEGEHFNFAETSTFYYTEGVRRISGDLDSFTQLVLNEAEKNKGKTS